LNPSSNETAAATGDTTGMRSILILLNPSVYKLLLYALSISPCRFFKLACSKCGVVVNVFVFAIMTVELAPGIGWGLALIMYILMVCRGFQI
jgi:hypothetical protein